MILETATAPAKSHSVVLNSWKEIASYLGRGVRTVQRYERDLGLPVRRPRGKSRSAVVALAEDLDAWLREAPTSEPRNSLQFGKLRVSQAPGNGKLHACLADHADLRTQCATLRNAHAEAMTALICNLTKLREEIRKPPVYDGGVLVRSGRSRSQASMDFK